MHDPLRIGCNVSTSPPERGATSPDLPRRQRRNDFMTQDETDALVGLARAEERKACADICDLVAAEILERFADDPRVACLGQSVVQPLRMAVERIRARR